MSKKYFISSPSYGFIENNKFKRFNDLYLFKAKSYLFTKLNQIKIWYGSASEEKKKDKRKIILGLESNYRLLGKNLQDKNRHLAKINSNDIETKELKLKDSSDYFSKMYLCVEDVITYLKFESNKGEVLEIGNFNQNTKKDISFNNDQNPHIIQTLHGFYDEMGLRALGARHIQANRYYFLNNMEILVIRHKIKHNNKFKEKWEKPENINNLNLGMKAILKLAFLPDNQFGFVFKFMIA